MGQLACADVERAQIGQRPCHRHTEFGRRCVLQALAGGSNCSIQVAAVHFQAGINEFYDSFCGGVSDRTKSCLLTSKCRLALTQCPLRASSRATARCRCPNEPASPSMVASCRSLERDGKASSGDWNCDSRENSASAAPNLTAGAEDSASSRASRNDAIASVANPSSKLAIPRSSLNRTPVEESSSRWLNRINGDQDLGRPTGPELTFCGAEQFRDLDVCRCDFLSPLGRPWVHGST